jgi:ankyrin repeat protein
MQVGRTALMIAAREGDKEIFDLQLEYDADVVQVDWMCALCALVITWSSYDCSSIGKGSSSDPLGCLEESKDHC